MKKLILVAFSTLLCGCVPLSGGGGNKSSSSQTPASSEPSNSQPAPSSETPASQASLSSEKASSSEVTSSGEKVSSSEIDPKGSVKYVKVKSSDQLANGSKVIITCDHDSLLTVWNGALDYKDIFAAKGASIIEYPYYGDIGDEFDLNYEEIAKAYFVIQKNSDSSLSIVLSSTANDEKPRYLTANKSSESFVTTTSSNAEKQKFVPSFSDGNILLTNSNADGNYSLYFNANSTSKRFRLTTSSSSNDLAIQMFLLQ